MWTKVGFQLDQNTALNENLGLKLYRISFFQNSNWDYLEPLSRDDNDTNIPPPVIFEPMDETTVPPVIFEPIEEDRGKHKHFHRSIPEFFDPDILVI